MTLLQETEGLLARMSRAEKAQLLQWVVRDLGDAVPGICEPTTGAAHPRVGGPGRVDLHAVGVADGATPGQAPLLGPNRPTLVQVGQNEGVVANEVIVDALCVRRLELHQVRVDPPLDPRLLTDPDQLGGDAHDTQQDRLPAEDPELEKDHSVALNR